MDDLALASVFPAATADLWRAAVSRVLKGADFDRTLVGTTADGIRIEPVYPKAERPSRAPGRSAAPWRIAAALDHPDPAAANDLAMLDLQGGADALTLVGPDGVGARGFGLRADDPAALDRALTGIMLDLVSVRLDTGREAVAWAERLLDLAVARGHAPDTLDLELGLDPIGNMARTAELPDTWDRELGGMLARVAGRGFAGRLLVGDGRPYHEAGASEAQELAALLATGVAYLRALEANGHAVEAARDTLSFVLVADADEFLTVAKLRAFRRLWAGIERSCGLDGRPARLSAETAWRMTTRRDPWVNLLRGTLAAFSAGIGGADTVAVLPFTAALGLPDAFARRLARNAQHVLLAEANLWRVADPVAGSGAFETLTDALAEEAWTRFTEIEREGGIVASLAAGALPGRIRVSRDRLSSAVAKRRDGLIGTSEFPNLAELPVTVLMPVPLHRSGDRVGLAPVRLAEAYERLRDVSDARLAANGRRPRVFLAEFGPASAFTARSTFARNAFEAVGIEVVAAEASPDALGPAFGASGADSACLCSSDAVYAESAPLAAAALKAAGARVIFLAGKPGDREAELRQAGVTGFLATGSDLPALLEPLVEASP